MASSNDKLDTCEVCAAAQAKYTCPKCEVRTCGLTCVNIHKKELECDGIRDKTKFVPLNSFTDLDLLSDYRLLEELGRSVERLQKNPDKKCTRQSHLPLHLMRLKNAAHNRGVNLQLMPQNFTRHKKNTTFFKWKENELYWRIEFIFPQAENVNWVVERVLETKRISDLLEEILNPNVQSELNIDETVTNKLSILQNKLKFYRACGLTGLKILLKAEKVEKSNSRFYELDLTKTVQENLKNKTIIEFPIIYVVLKDHTHMFEIIDTDDEELDSHDIKPWKAKKFKRNYKNNLDENKKSNQNIKKEESSLNYFFNGEISDSEEDELEMSSSKKKYQELHIPDYNTLVKMEH